MKIKTLIIDDEPLARQRIVNLLNDVNDIEIIDQCATGKKAIQRINEVKPALLFLDIKLKDMTGFNVLEQIDKKVKPIVVFISAYDEFALKAFEFFALDYLQKPFKDERFYKSTNKAIEIIKQNQSSLFENNLQDLLNYVNNDEAKKQSYPSKRIPIKLGNKVVFIENEEIKYIVASGYYAEIFTSSKKHLLRESLSNLMEQLNTVSFIRIHRSTIININFIQELINSNYGEIDVKMTDNKLFRISKSYKKEFLNTMGL